MTAATRISPIKIILNRAENYGKNQRYFYIFVQWVVPAVMHKKNCVLICEIKQPTNTNKLKKNCWRTTLINCYTKDKK